ncbi:DUF4395 family protein [Sulfurimonas sp.]|uniref:DUF4395 family protein n=1 Tax=Sulfurimonas sp. TaxID=2022749 RepID=UPI0035668AC6
MSYSCPVSFERIESNTSRLSSLIVSACVLYYFFTPNIYVLCFLFIDFFTRIFLKKEFSLIYLLSRTIKKSARMSPKYVDSGAKKLAGIFALIFIFLIAAANYMEYIIFEFLVGGIFILCSLLDAFVNYCVGCKIYYIIKKIYPNFMNP